MVRHLISKRATSGKPRAPDSGANGAKLRLSALSLLRESRELEKYSLGFALDVSGLGLGSGV